MKICGIEWGKNRTRTSQKESTQKKIPSLRIIYNDAQLKIHQKREIKKLKKEIKNLRSTYPKK